MQAATSRWWFVGKGHSALLGALFHAIVMFHANLRRLLGGFCGAHFGTILDAIPLRHQLAAVCLFLLLRLLRGGLVIGRQSEAAGK